MRVINLEREPLPVGGGGTCFHHPLTFFDLIPCSSLIKQLKCFELKFPWFQKLLRYSLDLQKWLSLFPISVCLFYLLFITEEIIIASRLVFPWTQQSNQQFPCSIKITWKYPLFPKKKCSCSRVPWTPWEELESKSDIQRMQNYFDSPPKLEMLIVGYLPPRSLLFDYKKFRTRLRVRSIDLVPE